MKWFLTFVVVGAFSLELGLTHAPDAIAIPLIAALCIFMVTVNFRRKTS